MIAIAGRTLGQVFDEAARRWPGRDFLVAPEPDGPRALTYGQAAAMAAAWADRFRAAGWGPGHRVAVGIGNVPEHLVLKLALNALGVSIVPVNPDYRPPEVAWLLADSDAGLVVAAGAQEAQIAAGMREAGRAVPILPLAALGEALPGPARPASGSPGPETEASLLYTSGTTGRPKGCILSHEYELMVGERYVAAGGLMALGEAERVLNPLPLYHLNAATVSFVGLLLAGGCQIQPQRFSRATWWRDIRACRASAFHYLGIIIPALMAVPEGPEDRAHGARLGIGAGVEPSLHRAFERRFGVELVEVWGMTEMCRILAASEEPSLPDTRAIGRPFPGLEVRVVDAEDRDVPPGEPGELVIRHSAATPRRGFFSGYLNRPDATEEVWRGGWFHTGDTVTQDASGMVFFVDRRKNIIRRSGENIAAAEVEACLLERPEVAQAAVLAVPDAMRDEEVMACVVPKPGVAADAALARALFDHAFARLAYYKAPGWLRFMEALPVTGTQKVQKHAIFPAGADPTTGAHDFRDLKKR